MGRCKTTEIQKVIQPSKINKAVEKDVSLPILTSIEISSSLPGLQTNHHPSIDIHTLTIV
jgi:hypothetical protein